MIAAGIETLPTPRGGPEVRLLDARASELDDHGLRMRAKAFSAEVRKAQPRAVQVSRSYRYPYALVTWYVNPVGVDIERIEPCDRAFAASISTPAEAVEWATLADPDRYFSSMWSSKEAVSKALGNAVDYDPRRLQAPMLWPGGEAGAWRAAELPVSEGYVAWLCWRE